MPKPTEDSMLQHLYDLILNPQLSQVERNLLIIGKNALEQGVYFPKVMQDLKLALAPLAVTQQLSPPVVELLCTISRHYPGDGVAALWNDLLR
ncbi:bacteriocin immunity protein [Aerococcaceae bacterium NML190073]|nr:bacteriocin immunity protein [Aerococcaceae bacterium NML190073]MCW6674352.1 bacteriocin immunity protein [Aerococcaceae bacterium NML171108]